MEYNNDRGLRHQTMTWIQHDEQKHNWALQEH